MNEDTLDMLRELALSLGTTSEYLWAALLRQALISGTSALVLTILAIAMFIYSLHRSSHLFKESEDIHPIYLVLVFSGVGTLIGILCLKKTLSALFNPEYWALMQILGRI